MPYAGRSGLFLAGNECEFGFDLPCIIYGISCEQFWLIMYPLSVLGCSVISVFLKCLQGYPDFLFKVDVLKLTHGTVISVFLKYLQGYSVFLFKVDVFKLTQDTVNGPNRHFSRA